jgi:hypothetical protein
MVSKVIDTVLGCTPFNSNIKEKLEIPIGRTHISL